MEKVSKKKRKRNSNTKTKLTKILTLKNEQLRFLFSNLDSSKGKKTEETIIFPKAFKIAAELIALSLKGKKRKKWEKSEFYHMCMDAKKLIFDNAGFIHRQIDWSDEKKKIAAWYGIEAKRGDSRWARLEWEPKNVILELFSENGKIIERKNCPEQKPLDDSTIHKIIYKNYEKAGLQVYRFIDGKKTNEEIMKKISLDRDNFLEIIDFLNNRGFITVAGSFRGPKNKYQKEEGELASIEKIIKGKYGDIGLQVLQLIDGKKTADEIMKKAGLSESKLIEIFDFMAEQRIIKLGLARGKGQIVSPAKKEAFGPLLSRTISIKRKRLEKYLRAAIKHYKKNEYAKAIEYYAKLINYYDTNGMLYNNRGCAYYKKQKFQDAIKDFNKAIKLKADYLEPYYNRGLSYASIEEYEKAAADFSKVIQFNPKFTKAYHLRGLSYEYSGNYNTAKFDYEKALKLNPELEEAKTHLRSIEEKIRKELRALPSKSGREETIDPNLLLLSPSCSLSDVGGMTELKELLRNEVERFLDEEKSKLAEKFGLDSSSAILLYGPPGCGKSRIIESLTGEFDCKLMKINISDILSKWYGTAEKNMHEIFEYAKTNQPIILFFDEIEALGGSREDISEHWARTMINQFLLEMDSVWKRKERILVMGATNAPWHVDNALMRSGRFGKTIFISSPDGKSRKEIFGIYVSKIKLKGKIDCEKLAKLTEGFSGANIEFICKEAALKKFNDSIAKGKEIKVCTDDFIEAINELRKRKTDVERWQDTIKKYHLDIESFPDIIPFKSNKKGSSGRMFG